MNSKLAISTTIATALIALAGAGSAFAQEGTQDFPATQTYSTQSRAAVKAELAAAQRAGTVTVFAYDEASPAPVASSTLMRVQVVAEAREGMRLGLVPFNHEATRAATPADLESIRVAGQRAVATAVAQAR
jgi:hypothetical protein